MLDSDLTRDEELPSFVANLGAALGERRIDTLVHNAAYTGASPIGVGSSDDLRRMIVANTLAPRLIVDGLHARIADGGAIIALSIAAVRQVFSPDFGFFAASKAAVDTLVRAWAVALGSRGIRANAIAPGVVDAYFCGEMLKDDAFRSALSDATALGRPGRVDDIADVAAFLASPAARWITGQVIDASGGWRL